MATMKQKLEDIKIMRDRWQSNSDRIADESWRFFDKGQFVKYDKAKRESDTIQHFVNDLNEIINKHVEQPSF